MKNVACVIVTYNRKDDLVVCLNAVFAQTFLPAAVYVVDNASTDGTEENLNRLGFTAGGDAIPESVEFHYMRMDVNLGGAGGFYTGMKTAFDTKMYDGYWLMDDDGIPAPECLESLVAHGYASDYLAPLVVDVEDPNLLAFEYMGSSREDAESKAHNNMIVGVACPFNGILYSHKLVETIGFPKKEMFIWGDEENYNMRAIKAGFTPVTVISAIHRHPANRVMTAQSLLGPIDVAPQMWRCYCRYRNAMYNHREEMSLLGKAYVFINHVWYYLVMKRSWTWTKCYIQAFTDGLKGDFTKLNQYKQ